MIPMMLNFVPADEAPPEWKDGEKLLSIDKYGNWKVVWWYSGWAGPNRYVCGDDGWGSNDRDLETVVPKYLAEIPDMPDA